VPKAERVCGVAVAASDSAHQAARESMNWYQEMKDTFAALPDA